jgi:hypothetical protein
MERIKASSTAFSVGKAGAATVVIMSSWAKAIVPSIIAASGRGLREFVAIFYAVHHILSVITANRYSFATIWAIRRETWLWIWQELILAPPHMRWRSN